MRKLVFRGGSTYSMVGTAEMPLQSSFSVPSHSMWVLAHVGYGRNKSTGFFSLLYAHIHSECASKTTRIQTRCQGFDHSLFLPQHHTLVSSPN